MTTPPRSRGPCSVIAATEFVTHTERHAHEAQEIHRARYGRLVRHRQSDGRAPRDGWLHGLRHQQTRSANGTAIVRDASPGRALRRLSTGSWKRTDPVRLTN